MKFVGALPKLDPIPVSKNRDVCGERKASEALVLSAERGVKGGVVLIAGVARGKKRRPGRGAGQQPVRLREPRDGGRR